MTKEDICQDCKYWNPTAHSYGECRQDCPTTDVNATTSTHYAIWPETKWNDWCGQFDPKAPKDELSGDND